LPELSTSPIGVELLDDPAADPITVAESLRNIARANRWFGGAAAVRYGLTRILNTVTPGDTLLLLDLGTGAGDLPRVAERWGHTRGIQITAVGLELSRAAARLARHSGLTMVVGCAGTPPIREKSVDVVLVSQVAHHLSPESVVHLFRTCNRLARRAVIIADLRRHALAASGFRLGARLLGFDAVTIADGVTSVRRGFTRKELLGLMAQAGITGRVDARPGFRLVATWSPEPV
jgi:hypothetical protein